MYLIWTAAKIGLGNGLWFYTGACESRWQKWGRSRNWCSCKLLSNKSFLPRKHPEEGQNKKGEGRQEPENSYWTLSLNAVKETPPCSSDFKMLSYKSISCYSGKILKSFSVHPPLNRFNLHLIYHLHLTCDFWKNHLKKWMQQEHEEPVTQT